MRDIDSIDGKIAAILEENSRRANTEIARELGISETTVRKRIKRLEEKGVIKNIAVINPEVLGYQIHLIVGVEAEYKKIQHVVKQLNEKQAVFFVGNSIGRYDIIFVAFFHSKEEMYRFLVDEISQINGIIRTESHMIIKMSKTNYVWGISSTIEKAPKEEPTGDEGS
jgi:Lrp/AsnC family transcriptional regulator for asnA, asnC and gidA